MNRTTIRIFTEIENKNALLRRFKARKLDFSHHVSQSTGIETVHFSIPVGMSVWRCKLDLNTGQVFCKGNATKTLSANNIWVMRTIKFGIIEVVEMLRWTLDELGAPAWSTFGFTLDRVELSRHFDFGTKEDQQGAFIKLQNLLRTRFPKECRTVQNSKGISEITVGIDKRNTVLRLCNPTSKKKPLQQMPPEYWTQLKDAARTHIRVDVTLNDGELWSAALDNPFHWDNEAEFADELLLKRYQRFGLSVDFRSDLQGFTTKEVEKENPVFVDYVRHWLTHGARGQAPSYLNEDYEEFQVFMLTKGYDVKVPFEMHKDLAHGLHTIFQPNLGLIQPPGALCTTCGNNH